MTTRKYSSRAQQTTLTGSIASGDLTMTVVSGSNLMGGKTPAVGETYTVVIDPDTSSEEIVDVSNYSSGNTLTIARGIDGSSAVSHSAGAVVRHMVVGRDLQEANTHIENATTAHGLTIANVLTTASTNISSANIANDTIMNADINTSAGIVWTKLDISSTVDATEIGYVNGVTSAIQTQIDSKLATATASSTYAPLASPALTGVPTAPTAAANTNTTQVATTAYVQTELNDLIASAPAALDTLNELSAALGNDANFATTTANSIAAKLPLAGGTMSGAIAMGTSKITGMGEPTLAQDAATKNYVDTITVAPSNLTGPITSTGSATAIASQTGTGTKFVVDTSPTLVTPVLGVATATSINGTTIPNTKTLVVTTDKLSALSGTTSAELAGVISDETGTGALVFANTPTLVTPVLGVATATSINGATVPSVADTLVGRATTDTLTNKTLTSPVITGAVFNDGSVVFEGATANDFETTLAVTDPTADRTITLPNATGTVALTSDIVAPAFVGASVYKASGQVITGATWTTLLFDTENFDTSAFHDTSSNTGRMTVPSGKAGYYELTAVLNFYCTDYNLRLLKNGSNVTQGLSNAYIGQDRFGGGAYFVEYGKFVINLAVGDYLEVQFLNSVGVTLDAQVLQLVYLGA